MRRVTFRPAAEADLVAIALFVGQSSVERAETLIGRLRARCQILESHPLAGRARPELGPDLRGLVERPYVILYRVFEGVAEVVAIVHGARDLPAVIAAKVRDQD